MSILSVNSLSLAIGNLKLLEDVSFNVAAGEIVAVTGESGSGKSLTALSIMQLLPTSARTSGTIDFLGNNLLTTPEREMCDLRGQQISMVFQEPMTALNPVQTIGAQVVEVVRIHKKISKSAAKNLAEDILTRVGLPPDRVPMSRYPHELSGGQRQRVVIALAMMLRPKLLIADEPTTALDVTTQAKILELLKSLVREFDMGLIFITHDLAVVSQMADRMIVMNKGKVVESGETQRVLTRPRHPYTQSLRRAASHTVKSVPRETLDKQILSATNATRTYNRNAPAALTDVTFKINQGDRIGLVGESGSGKSTLARAILGLEPLQGGMIHFKGEAVHVDMPSRQRAAMQVVFQDPFGSFNPRHKVGRLIAEPYFLHPNAPKGIARETEIADTLQSVGLHPSDAEKYIHEFSGGQRQRIAIARALILKPEFVIFDEAVSALDVSTRARILDLIADISSKRNLTYLFISHDLNVVREVTDRVLVIKSGKIVEQGPTPQVFDTPKHPYTQSLLAASPRLEAQPDLELS